MTTIRHPIQTSPAEADALVAKLADTSEGAVKTRDRLFSELKAKLEEQRLFPVLKKHEGTKGLVAGALDDNRQTRKLLAELERTPTDSEAFGAKVAELRKAFQRHVRDDEASAVAGKMEDEKARIEAARRADDDERRAEAKLEREKADAARQAQDERVREEAEAARRAEAKRE